MLGLAALALGLAPGALTGAAQPPAPERGTSAARVTVQGVPALTVGEALTTLDSELEAVVSLATAGDGHAATSRAVRAYLDHFEPLEVVLGAGAPGVDRSTSRAVAGAEAAFHRLMAAGEDPVEVRRIAEGLEERIASLSQGVDGSKSLQEESLLPSAISAEAGASRSPPGAAGSQEVAGILSVLEDAERAYQAGRRDVAARLVERAYLEGFEPIEARLPGSVVGDIERGFHLVLRPRIARAAPEDEVALAFAQLRGDLGRADVSLSSDRSFWFGAFNSFLIIVREGLEAVLLIGALLAYVTRSESGRVEAGEVGQGRASRARRQIHAGVGAGILASVGTWLLAVTLIPIGGASRELIEGVTALVAVAVLVYVSNWLFQKTYIQDWKEYLRAQVGRAMGSGSALAMAGLAFAAVYREGFETVLFYQALILDVGSGAVMAGFAPGLVLIAGLGVGILRLGMKLPLRQTFMVTNAVLLYLAFVFLGKGIYNLQEAGLFTAHPVAWMPDGGAIRQLLGTAPLLEVMVAQALFLAFVAGSYVFYRRSSRKSGAALTPVSVTGPGAAVQS